MSLVANYFIGSQTVNVDAKGRIAIPAPFRKVLEAKGTNGFCGTPNLNQPEHIECGGPDFVEAMHNLIDEYEALGEERAVMQEAVLGRMKEMTLDADGRFILHPSLRERAGIKDQAFFIGLGATFQIREGAAGEARMKDIEQRAKEAAARIKIPAHKIFRKSPL
jgi:MraZ protein